MFEASSKALRNWRPDVAREVRRAVDAQAGATRWDGAAYVALLFTMPRPRGDYGTGRNVGQLRPGALPRPAKSPDIDKLARAVLDGIVLGGALADDSQIVDLALSKVYATSAQGPGVEITIRYADPAYPLVPPMARQLASPYLTETAARLIDEVGAEVLPPMPPEVYESLGRSAALLERINGDGAELRLGGRAPGIYVDGQGPL